MSRSSSLILGTLPHLAAILVIVMCGRLAFWQFDRADEKRQLLQAWAQAPAVSLDAATEQTAERYVRITASGRFDASRQILLDNQLRGGQPGVHVFTPFRAEGEERLWLVNRGWHPLTARSGSLPEVSAPEGDLSLSGRVVDAPRVGLQLGEARALDTSSWPKLVTYLDLGRVAAALDGPLANRVVLLDPAHPAHLTGEAWQPVNFGPNRHLAYAWQWITMAVVVFFIWVVLTWRSLRKS